MSLTTVPKHSCSPDACGRSLSGRKRRDTILRAGLEVAGQTARTLGGPASVAGHSLAETLLIRPGASLWFSPTEWLRILGPLPPGVRMTGEFAAATVAVVFVSNAASVRWFLDRYRTVMALPPVVWMCYPAHGRTDLNRASLLNILAGHSLHPGGEVAIDASWAAMRLRPIARAR